MHAIRQATGSAADRSLPGQPIPRSKATLGGPEVDPKAGLFVQRANAHHTWLAKSLLDLAKILLVTNSNGCAIWTTGRNSVASMKTGIGISACRINDSSSSLWLPECSVCCRFTRRERRRELASIPPNSELDGTPSRWKIS